MSTRYELVDWENLGYNLPQSLPYASPSTIAEALLNIRSAGTFVVAVENDVRRPLTEAEGLEFHSEYHDHMNRTATRCRITVDKSRLHFESPWAREKMNVNGLVSPN
jgi:hypothetical protein